MNRVRALSCLVPAVMLLAGCGSAPGGDDSDPVGTAREAVAPPGSNAHFVSSTVPAALFPGERRLIQVTMQNTGASSPANNWTTSGPAYALAAVNLGWGWSYSYVPSPVATGFSNTFNVILTAPAASTSFTARMAAVGLGNFGDTVTVPVTISNATTPQWGCTFVPGSSTVPTTMTANENRFITVTVRNTGTASWTTSNFFLTSQDSPVTLWNQTNAPLPTAVAPGATASFGLSIRAPATAGTYSFMREMSNAALIGVFRKSGFCVNQSIVVGGAPALDATVNSQNFPTPMAPNEVRSVTVSMKNTGTETWAADGTYMLYSENAPITLWGVTQSNVGTATVSGASVSLFLNVKAPATPGTYAQKWQMRKTAGGEAGVFGSIINIPIVVDGSVTPSFGATVASQSIPTLVTSGKTYSFQIRMTNSGSTAWTGSNFMLYSTNTPINLWHVTQSPLGGAETVAAAAQRLFNLTVTAPAAAGTYSSTWQMRQVGGVNLFGAVATTNNIVVTLCGNSAIDAGEQCDDGNLTNGDGCTSACAFEQVQDDLSVSGFADRTLKGTGSGGQLSPVTMGDVTADGVPDIMVSSVIPAAGTGTGKGSAGSVYGFVGGTSFRDGSSTTIPTGSGFQIGGADSNDGLAGVASGRMIVGQIVGDATADLAVSAALADGPGNGRSNCGEVYIIQGGASLARAGLINLGAATMPSQVTAHIIGEAANDALIVLGIGDLTGDSVNDVLLGAPGNSSGAGALYVVTGGSLSGDIDLSSPPGGLVIYKITGAAGTGLGARATIGDLNADGKADILASCPGSSPGGRSRAGTVFAKFGPVSTSVNFSNAVGSAAGPTVAWFGEHANDGLGSDLAIGNVTGTATNEALIGGIQIQKAGVQVGGVTIWSGVTAGTTYDLSAGAVPTSQILGADANDDCGTAIELGDMNKDGLLDIAFSCSAADGLLNARTSSGEIDVVLGRASFPATYNLTTTPSNFVLLGADAGGFTGRHNTSLAVADMDGDGRADMCAGSYLGSNGTAKSGRVDCLLSPF